MRWLARYRDCFINLSFHQSWYRYWRHLKSLTQQILCQSLHCKDFGINNYSHLSCLISHHDFATNPTTIWFWVSKYAPPPENSDVVIWILKPKLYELILKPNSSSNQYDLFMYIRRAIIVFLQFHTIIYHNNELYMSLYKSF